MNKKLESIINVKNMINKSLTYIGVGIYLFTSVFCLVYGYLPYVNAEINPFIWMFIVAPTALTMFTFFLQLLAKMLLSSVLVFFISKREVRYVLVENN